MKKQYISPLAEGFELLKPKTMLAHFSGEATFGDLDEMTPEDASSRPDY